MTVTGVATEAPKVSARRVRPDGTDRYYLSDVVFGATLGTVIGISALRAREREALRLVPSQPGGAGLAVTAAW